MNQTDRIPSEKTAATTAPPLALSALCLRQLALSALQIIDPQQKAAATRALASNNTDSTHLDVKAIYREPAQLPCRPARPLLVPPMTVPRRGIQNVEDRAALIHALAHIELNAIDLALDICWRFPDQPVQFYEDWLKVAREEALHFTLLSNHLVQIGYAYGDFPAHNGLWEMAEKTKGDLLARLALVPRTLEARGLDVTPSIRSKLIQAGDARAGEILSIILRDEIGHVSIGNHWYKTLCQASALDPIITYRELAEKYSAPKLRGPFNTKARLAAGFSPEELIALNI